MLDIIFAIILFYCWWHLGRQAWTDKDTIATYTRHAMFIAGCAFIVSFVYSYAVLPLQITSFYNDGAGLSYIDPQNSSQNLTIFSEGDEKVALFQGRIVADYWVVSVFQTYSSVFFLLFLAAFLIWYAWYKVLMVDTLKAYEIDNNYSNLRVKSMMEAKRNEKV